MNIKVYETKKEKIKDFFIGFGSFFVLGVMLYIIGAFVSNIATIWIADPDFISFFIFPILIPLLIILGCLFFYKKRKFLVIGFLSGLVTFMILFGIYILLFALYGY